MTVRKKLKKSVSASRGHSIRPLKKEIRGRDAGESDRKIILLCLIAVVAAAWAAFGTSINGVFLWDDEYVVLQNLLIRDLTHLPLLVSGTYFEPAGTGHYTRSGEESYRPLVTLTHFADYALFGLHPAGYHLVNILLHTAAAAALFCMLYLLGIGPLASLIGALIFAVHPVNSEAVNMISYREDLLAGFFLALAWIGFLKKRPAAVILFYGAALLSKEMTLCFIPLLLLYHFLIGSGKDPKGRIPAPEDERRNRTTVSRKTGFPEKKRSENPIKFLPSLTPGVLAGLLIVTIIYLAILFFAFPGGSPGPADRPGGSFASGMATMARVMAAYMKLFFYPSPLAVDYSFDPSTSFPDGRALLSVLLIAGMILLPLIFPIHRKAAFLILWFFAALLPVSGIFPLKNFIAERYLYIPLMGWCGAAGMGFTWMIRRKGLFRILSAAALAACLLLFIYMNNMRNPIWSDEERFFNAMVHANPESYKGHSSLGSIYYRQGKLEAAEKAMKQSILINPDYAISRHNLGCVLLERDKKAEAKATFRQVIHLDPSFTEAHYQLAILSKDEGKLPEAEASLRIALAVNPNFIPAKFILGTIFQERHDLREAIRLYEEILSLDPNYAKAVKNLAIIHYYQLSDPETAAGYFRRYLALVPDDPQRDMILEAVSRSGQTAPGNP